MNDDNTEYIGYNICKFLLILSAVCAVIARIHLEKYTNSTINQYMAFVNFFSLLFSINTFTIAVYINLKKVKKQLKQNKIIDNIIMLSYIACYLGNLSFVVVSLYLYFYKYPCNLTIVNDVYGIISLGLALTYDYIVTAMVNLVSGICM